MHMFLIDEILSSKIYFQFTFNYKKRDKDKKLCLSSGTVGFLSQGIMNYEYNIDKKHYFYHSHGI